MAAVQRLVLFALTWCAYLTASSTLTSFSVQASVPSAEPFHFRAYHQGFTLGCTITPNTTSTWFTCDTSFGANASYPSTTDGVTLTITHIGATPSTTLSISSLLLTHNNSLSSINVNAFCSCQNLD